MRSTIGGRQLEITRQEVSRRMKHVEPEPARQHEVLVDGVWFHPSKCWPWSPGGKAPASPPRKRSGLCNDLGFAGHRVHHDGLASPPRPDPRVEDLQVRVQALMSALSVAQAAVGGLASIVVLSAQAQSTAVSRRERHGRHWRQDRAIHPGPTSRSKQWARQRLPCSRRPRLPGCAEGPTPAVPALRTGTGGGARGRQPVRGPGVGL